MMGELKPCPFCGGKVATPCQAHIDWFDDTVHEFDGKEKK